MKLRVTTFRTVEYLRKGKRLPERKDFRLDLTVDVKEINKKSMKLGFKAGRQELHGYQGRFWRPAFGPSSPDAQIKDGTLALDEILIGRPSLVDRRRVWPSDLDAFDDKGCTIFKDDIEDRKTLVAKAVADVIVVNRKPWVRAPDPVWAVTAGFDNPAPSVDLVVNHEFEAGGEERWRNAQLFRVDRIADAERWGAMLKGRAGNGGPDHLSEDEIDAKLAARGVTLLDRSLLSRDDVVWFASTYCAVAMEYCTAVLHAAPPALRKQWQELRDLMDAFASAEPRKAAEAAIRLVPEIAGALKNVRDVDTSERSVLMRGLARLNSLRRRAEAIEGIRSGSAMADDDVDLGWLSP